MTEQVDEPIWMATVDADSWRVKVTRVTHGQGELTVTQIKDDGEDGEVILSETVGLMFGAVFGPDVDDVRMWQHMAVEAVDHYNAHHKESHETEA